MEVVATAKVFVATKADAVEVASKIAGPPTDKRAPGVLVAMPINPSLPDTISKGVEVPWSPITKIGVVEPTIVELASIENWAYGDVEPKPNFPYSPLIEEVAVMPLPS